MKNATVLTVQNGVRAESLLKESLPEASIVSSIVMFGATYLEPGRVVHNFEGGWVMGRAFAPNDDRIEAIGKVLGNAFPVTIASNIRGMKWLKLFLNLNNCLPAILGKSMQEGFASLEIAKLAMRLWQEALAVVDKAGIVLASLPEFRVEKLRELAGMPVNESAKIYSGIMVNLSQEPLYGSILQSLKRGRPSEIDYINGEIAALGEEIGMAAPLNRRVTEMVHRVETSGSFFPEAAVLAELER
jgi:2-dehydropantoate 2-reductase